MHTSVLSGDLTAARRPDGRKYRYDLEYLHETPYFVGRRGTNTVGSGLDRRTRSDWKGWRRVDYVSTDSSHTGWGGWGRVGRNPKKTPKIFKLWEFFFCIPPGNGPIV